MKAQILNGTDISETIISKVKEEALLFKGKKGYSPTVAIIRIGENPAGKVYVKRIKKTCEKSAINAVEYFFPADCNEEEYLSKIDELNRNDKIHGILPQMPFPDGTASDKIIELINPIKDIDGVNPINTGKIFTSLPYHYPATPWGIYRLLELSQIEMKGKHVVILGRSNVVGKPMAGIFLKKEISATVTVCHSRTKNLEYHTGNGDILIASIGKAGFVKANMVKEGSVVIDVGINVVPDGTGKTKITGDVDFAEVSEKASFITPVPGGVGPMTMAVLMENILNGAKRICQ